MKEVQEINQLPKDWKKQKFAEVIEFLTDFQANGSFAGLKDNVQYYSEKNFAVLVRLKDLRHDLKDENAFVYTDEKGYEFLKKSRVVEGDVLVANVGAGVGTTLKMPKFIGKATLGPNMFRVDLKESISSKFFFAFSNSLNYWQQLKLVSAGSGQPKINKSQYRSIEIPVPPLETQLAIVSKIEELFSELDKGIENLRIAQQQLKTYRQAVLKWAFEGKLTNENVKDGELPEGWQECEIKKVCNNIKVGIVVKPTNFYSKDREGVKAFRSANVREFKINDSDWVYFTKEANEINYRTKLKEGDVLLVRSGYPGTSCVVSKRFDGTNAIDILIVTPNKSLISSAYLCAFNNSPLGKGMFRTQSRGVAQKHLNVGEYSKLKINFPSLTQQENIILEIERRLSVADKMEESINQSLQQAEALRQSILKKAFEGRII